ncbi:MAG: hypothetical protein F4Z53_08615 [Acidimicrobiales bacterium]|nr:hypothetical protein [Acidimicrobiales bacterium]MYI09159.1 hypothetical protein [Acidimicrobiales bacterium]
MSTPRIPLLTEDGSRLDWPDAQYEPQIERKGAETKVTVSHVLKGATALADAVRRGEAAWHTEVRCPRLLHSEHVTSRDDRQVVEWREDAVDWEKTYLLPGMASVGSVLRAPEELAAGAWAPGEAVEVPAGALLVRADVRRLKPLMQSLLVFRRDDALGDGQMRVEEDTASDDPCFVVRIAADIFAESRWNRDRRVAALIGAFAAMARPGSRVQPDGELRDHPVTKQLLAHLLERGSSTWDEEDFDCVYAATLFEPMEMTEAGSEDGDDE